MPYPSYYTFSPTIITGRRAKVRQEPCPLSIADLALRGVPLLQDRLVLHSLLRSTCSPRTWRLECLRRAVRSRRISPSLRLSPCRGLKVFFVLFPVYLDIDRPLSTFVVFLFLFTSD